MEGGAGAGLLLWLELSQDHPPNRQNVGCSRLFWERLGQLPCNLVKQHRRLTPFEEGVSA
jgi:hypothetical protein